MRVDDILYFWFTEYGPKEWWQKSIAFDQLVFRKFYKTYMAAAQGELGHWRRSERGRLAEIIVLDQFPRNMFRGQPRSFATDCMALVLAQEAVLYGVGQAWCPDMLQFLYMPYMHSESLHIHDKAVELFSAPGLESNLDFEFRHKRIIERFGRYPHRNVILGRKSSAEELAFLKEPDSHF